MSHLCNEYIYTILTIVYGLKLSKDFYYNMTCFRFHITIFFWQHTLLQLKSTPTPFAVYTLCFSAKMPFFFHISFAINSNNSLPISSFLNRTGCLKIPRFETSLILSCWSIYANNFLTIFWKYVYNHTSACFSINYTIWSLEY